MQVSDASDRVLRSTLSLRTFIAGIDVDRRLWRDLLRPLHMVPAPPQVATLPTPGPAPPTMATTNKLEERAERWQYTEATVGDMFQGDLARHGLILLPT